MWYFSETFLFPFQKPHFVFDAIPNLAIFRSISRQSHIFSVSVIDVPQPDHGAVTASVHAIFSVVLFQSCTIFQSNVSVTSYTIQQPAAFRRLAGVANVCVVYLPEDQKKPFSYKFLFTFALTLKLVDSHFSFMSWCSKVTLSPPATICNALVLHKINHQM